MITKVLIRLALALPMFYHGVWDFSATGERYFREQVQATYNVPAEIRFVLGTLDLLLASLLALGIQTRICALIFLPLMLGGVFADWGNGFSYRQGGYEVHLCYSILALALVLDKRRT